MAKKLTEVEVTLTQLGNTDLILATSNTAGVPTTVVIEFQNLFANVVADAHFANLSVEPITSTPADSNDYNGVTGAITFDSNYIYISTGNTQIKRVALDTF